MTTSAVFGRTLYGIISVAAASACASGGGSLPVRYPVVDVARISALKIMPAPFSACPGEVLRVGYVAVLDDGTEREFASRGQASGNLDPALLAVQSPTATLSADGQLETNADPLASAIKGFPVQVSLVGKSSVSAETVITPRYDCLPRAIFASEGSSTRVCAVDATGRASESQCDLVPQVARNAGGGPARGAHPSVRLGIVRTPFFDSLLIAVVEIPGDRPVVLLAPRPITRGMISVSAPGRKGGPGREGRQGERSETCAPGGSGKNGEDGRTGGEGRTLSIIVQDDDPLLQGVVTARLEGGEGGPGGAGGRGGLPGIEYGKDPVTGAQTIKCRGTVSGLAGAPGNQGTPGRGGSMALGALPLASLFHESALWQDPARRAALSELLSYSGRRTAP